jgi:hypothetical protein
MCHKFKEFWWWIFKYLTMNQDSDLPWNVKILIDDKTLRYTVGYTKFITRETETYFPNTDTRSQFQ